MTGWSDDRMVGWPDGQMTWWSDGQKSGWPDGQMAGWPEDQMARSPDGQKTIWHIKQILKKWCSQCYTGYTPNVLPEHINAASPPALLLLLSSHWRLSQKFKIISIQLFWPYIVPTFKKNSPKNIKIEAGISKYSPKLNLCWFHQPMAFILNTLLRPWLKNCPIPKNQYVLYILHTKYYQVLKWFPTSKLN